MDTLSSRANENGSLGSCGLNVTGEPGTGDSAYAMGCWLDCDVVVDGTRDATSPFWLFTTPEPADPPGLVCACPWWGEHERTRSERAKKSRARFPTNFDHAHPSTPGWECLDTFVNTEAPVQVARGLHRDGGGANSIPSETQNLSSRCWCRDDRPTTAR